MSHYKTALKGLLCVALLIVMPGCDTTVSQALQIMGSVAPDNSCQVKAQGGAQQSFVGTGTLDLSVGTSYHAYMMTANNFPSSEELTGEGTKNAAMDSGSVNIYEVVITYRIEPTLLAQQAVVAALAEVGLPATTELSITVPASATILPNSSMPIEADIIPHNLGYVLRAIPEIAAGQEVIVGMEVIAKGIRTDQRLVQSGAWSFAVRLCNNCMMEHRFSEAIAKQPFTFPGLEEPLNPEEDFGEFCNPGQDRSITNAYCGSQWGPDSPKANACQLDRCLGKADTTLQCAEDNITVFAPPVPQD